MGEEFSYAEEFKSLDLNAVIKDLHALYYSNRKTGGRPTSAITAGFSFVWRGTARERTGSPTGAAAQAPGSNGSRHSTAGPTT